MSTPPEEQKKIPVSTGTVAALASKFGTQIKLPKPQPTNLISAAAAATATPSSSATITSLEPVAPTTVETPDEKAIQQSNLARESITAFAKAAKILDIPYIGLRSGSLQPTGAAWKRIISIPKPRVYADKSFSYNGPLGGFFPIYNELGRRNVHGEPVLIHGDSPLTEGHIYYKMTHFQSCLSDVLEAVARRNCNILHVTPSYIYFENIRQNEDASKEHKKIIYRIKRGAMEDPSAYLQVLQGLVEKRSKIRSIQELEQQLTPEIMSQLSSDQLFLLHGIEATVYQPSLNLDEKIADYSQLKYEPVMVHSFESNPIGSDIDTAMIPVPAYLLQADNPMVKEASRLFDSANKNERNALQNHVAALLEYYCKRESYSNLVQLLMKNAQLGKFISQESYMQIAFNMIKNLAYQDSPGVISPFEVLYYSLVNILNREEMLRELTAKEIEHLTFSTSFNCVQHAADSNFAPTDPELLKKVGRPGDILFIIPADSPTVQADDDSKQAASITSQVPAQLIYAKTEEEVLSFLKAHEQLRSQAFTQLSTRYTAIDNDAFSGAWHQLIGEELTRRHQLKITAAPISSLTLINQ